MKLVNAEYQQVWIFYTKFHQNRSRNMEITLTCSFAPFCILEHDGQFARSPSSFLSQSFAAVRQMGKVAWSPHKAFSFLVCNERPRKVAHRCNTAPLPPYPTPPPCRNHNSYQSSAELTQTEQVSVAVVVRHPLCLC